MTKSEVYKISRDKCSMKYFVLVPHSCKVLSSFEGKHETGITIARKDCVEFTYHHVGKDRQMKIIIYNISKGDEV